MVKYHEIFAAYFTMTELPVFIESRRLLICGIRYFIRTQYSGIFFNFRYQNNILSAILSQIESGYMGNLNFRRIIPSVQGFAMQ